MFPLVITAVILLILLCGVSWHDEPARRIVVQRRPSRKRFPRQ